MIFSPRSGSRNLRNRRRDSILAAGGECAPHRIPDPSPSPACFSLRPGGSELIREEGIMRFFGLPAQKLQMSKGDSFFRIPDSLRSLFTITETGEASGTRHLPGGVRGRAMPPRHDHRCLDPEIICRCDTPPNIPSQTFIVPVRYNRYKRHVSRRRRW